MFNRIFEYVKDTKFKIIYEENKVNIINYKQISDFTDKKIDILSDKYLINIVGTSLAINKMLSDELLINGNIEGIYFKKIDE